MKTYLLLFPLLIIFWNASFSQEKSIEAFDKAYLNWYNSDLTDNDVLGAGVEKAYAELLSGKPVKKTVIVAVIDGGVDITIDDLKEKIWVNAKEIAGNGVDDDGNGYTDDLYGWNFIGNSKGENIVYENLEITRVYKAGGGNEQFLKAKALYDEEYKSKSEDKVLYDKFETIVKTYKSIIITKTGVEVNGPEDLAKVKSDEPDVKEALKFLKERLAAG